MTFLLNTKQRFATLVVVALALMIALAACESSPTPTPAPTATPTPSPTPTPVPDPIINLSEDSTFKDFVDLLPAETVSCLVAELGQATFDQISSQPVFGDDIGFDGDLPLACFDQDAVISLVIAGLAQAADGLSDGTVVCIRETFGGLDVESLGAIASGDISGGAMGDALGVGIGLLLCLNDDEASRITAGGIFGDIGGASEISLADVRCVLGVVDISELVGLVDSFESGAVPDLSTSLTLLTAFSDCGISIADLTGETSTDGTDGALDGIDGSIGDILDGIDGGSIPEFDLSDLSQLPPETQAMLQCVIDALGEENVNGLVAGTYVPTLADFGALSACNLDFAQLGDLDSLLGG
jgi:hypothetical protein